MHRLRHPGKPTDPTPAPVRPRSRPLELSALQWGALVAGWSVMAVVVLLYVHHYLGTAHFL